MRRHARMVLAAGLLFAQAGLPAAADDSKQQAVQKAREELQGTWKVVSVQSRGKRVPDQQLRNVRFTFQGDKLFIGEPKGRSSEQPYKIDPSKDPKTFDQVQTYNMQAPGRKKGRTIQHRVTIPGIYTLEGDKLKICASSPGEKRPSDFEARKDRTLIVLEREKR